MEWGRKISIFLLGDRGDLCRYGGETREETKKKGNRERRSRQEIKEKSERGT